MSKRTPEKTESISSLGMEFIILHSGDTRKASHTTDVLESKSNEKAEHMTSWPGLEK